MSGKKSGKLNRLFNKRDTSDELVQEQEQQLSESNNSISSSQEDNNAALATGTQTPSEPQNPARLLARQHALSIMAKHTYQEAKKEQLICPIQHDHFNREYLHAVALKISRGHYAFWPRGDESVIPFISSLCQLNVGVSLFYFTFN